MYDDQTQLDPREECFRIPGPVEGLKLFLRYLAPPGSPGLRRAVLCVHGMSFPSALSVAHRMDGKSWRDELCACGFDVWALDFYGFGQSDRYAEMSQPTEINPPLGRVETASVQIEYALRFIAAHHGYPSVSVVAHSGACMAAGALAVRHPDLVDGIVFFAPIVRRAADSRAVQRFPAWRVISLKDQWDRFTADVPHGESAVLSQFAFRDWGERYLDSDPGSRSRSPASVKTPCGLTQDVVDAWHGTVAYDPAKIRSPVAIIRGELDTWSNENDAQALLHSLRGLPIRRHVNISRGTHVMHLEESRYALTVKASVFCRREMKRRPPGGRRKSISPRKEKHQ